jgi:pimeloyl-ACP methyl ester carboxylesterase
VRGRTLLYSLLIASDIAIVTPPLAAEQAEAPLAIARQGSFLVGGHDVHSDTLSALPSSAPFGPVGTITVDQMYVRFQVPVGATGRAVTFIHGCCFTGQTWETTPDGRMGWDEYFLRKGHAVYIVDQASRGRSGGNPSPINAAIRGKADAGQLPPVFVAGHESAWTLFRFGPEYAKAWPGLQYPLDAVAELWKQLVPDWTFSLPTPNPTVAALSELAGRVKNTVLVSHSQSGILPFQAAALDTKNVAAIVALEPAACPAADADLTPYLKIPILVVWADFVDRSAFWSPRQKSCQAFVDAVTARGGKAESFELPSVGFHGNSHMFMQDKNNRDIADWLLNWIDRHAG